MSAFQWKSRDARRDDVDEELRPHLAMAVRDRVALRRRILVNEHFA